MRGKESTIIKFLIESKNEELNIRSISKSMKMDYKNVYSIIKRLEKGSLVKIETFGQSSRVKLNAIVHPLVFEAEFERRKEILRDKNLAVMLSSFKRAIKSKLYVLLLFGSYAKRTQTKSSDIDLIVICLTGLKMPLKRISIGQFVPCHCLCTHWFFRKASLLRWLMQKSQMSDRKL